MTLVFDLGVTAESNHPLYSTVLLEKSAPATYF